MYLLLDYYMKEAFDYCEKVQAKCFEMKQSSLFVVPIFCFVTQKQKNCYTSCIN